jgi:hypothetical protein
MTTPSHVPPPGAIILLPLVDGRFGAARVLRNPTPEEQKCFMVPVALVAVTPWVGEGPPDLGVPELHRTLRLTHEFNPPELCVQWASTPPAGFSTIGELRSSEDDLRFEHPPRTGARSADWKRLAGLSLLQWRRDHPELEGARLSDGVRRAVTLLLGVVGADAQAAAMPEHELANVERRLGTHLPPVLRAFYATCGHLGAIFGNPDAARFGLLAPPELVVQEAHVRTHRPAVPTVPMRLAVIFRTASGYQLAAALGDASEGPGSAAEWPPSGKGAWQRKGTLFQALLERASWSAALAMPHRFSTVAPYVDLPGFTPLGTTLDNAGLIRLAETARCDEALGVVLVRMDDTSEAWTIGARDATVRAELERRLGVPVIPTVADGKPVKPPRVARSPAEVAPAAPPTSEQLDEALTKLVRAGHGDAVTLPPAKVDAGLAPRPAGRDLPWALRSFHAFAHVAPELLRADRRVVPLDALAVDKGVLWIAHESQAVVRWGVREADLASPDPPVWQYDKQGRNGAEYAEHLSAFLAQTAGWQITMAMEWKARLSMQGERIVRQALAKVEKLLPRIGHGQLSTPAEECYASVERGVVASAVLEPTVTTVYFGGTHEALGALDKAFKAKLDWL